MRVHVFGSDRALARALAANIAGSLDANPSLVLGLPTGRTPILLYREVVRMHLTGHADFSHATTFNLDEFLHVDARDMHSYRSFMQRHLFDHVNMVGRRIQFLNGAARDIARECDRYERAIDRAGGIGLQILGLGTNGHIGFNEPAEALMARTHRTRLRPATRRANAALFDGRLTTVPREALSMGMATILRAKRIVLVATGATKARVVQRMIEGPVTPRLPGSFLQLHRCAEVWLDRAAAAKLRPA